MDSLTEKKAAASKGSIRSFMKTAKTDLKQMVMADAASSATGMDMSATVVLPKNAPLVCAENEGAATQPNNGSCPEGS